MTTPLRTERNVTTRQPRGDHAAVSDKPLATFAVIAYNQERFIREAVEGAFAQTYSPLEILLSDDGSSDKTFDVMQELVAKYDGPHQVMLNRNERNLGLVRHVNRVLELSSGHLIAIAAGDDVSLPRRVETSVHIFKRNPELMSVSLGLMKGATPKQRLEDDRPAQGPEVRMFCIEDYCASTTLHANAPARMIRREVYTKFGPLNHDCQVEDQPLLFRALLLGSIGISTERAVFYRVHGANISAGAGRKEFDFNKIYRNCIDDTMTAIQEGYIERSRARKILRAVDRHRKRDELWRGYKNSSTKVGFFFLKMLPSTVIPLRAKLRRLRALAFK